MIWKRKRIVADDQDHKKIPIQDGCVRWENDIFHFLDVRMTPVVIAAAQLICVCSDCHCRFVVLIEKIRQDLCSWSMSCRWETRGAKCKKGALF